MEEINNTVCPNNPNQFNQIQKPNIYKYLFFISLIIFFGVIIYLTTTNNKNFQLTNNKINNVNETKPIEIVEEKNNKNKGDQGDKNRKNIYKAVSVEDDKNSVSKLVLIDQNNNETIIDETEYSKAGEEILKPMYEDFLFSPDNSFLYYWLDYRWEVAGKSYLYDIKNRKKIEIGFRSDFSGFSPDLKYFYACSRDEGMRSGGAIIKGLNPLGDIYKSSGESSYLCFYRQDSSLLELHKITYDKYTKFDEKTGILTEY